MQQEFVGRQDELGKLGRFIASPESGIAVIFGRHRIGKTRLAQEAFRGPEILFFEAPGEGPLRAQLSHFKHQLNLQLEAANRPRKEALLELLEVIRGRSCPIVFRRISLAGELPPRARV